MAEFVAKSVAQIRNELEAVQFLSLDEKRRILKKHERLEYRLRKRQRRETDFLMYIQYCKDVMQFFKMRKKQRGIQSRAEVPIIKRIHQLYQLCETRFPQSTDVWLHHIDFCKQLKEFSRVGRLFTQMLRTHSTEPELWVEAARWEVEQSNVDGARTLMQRCVSTNKISLSAWVQYYKLELEIAKAVRGKHKEINQSDPTMSGQVAQLVLKHARLQCPESHQLLQSLIEVTDKFPFTHTDGVEMLKELKETFSNVPSVRDFIARRALQKKKKKNTPRRLERREEQFFSCFEEAVSDIPTSEMWSLYLKAARELFSAPSANTVHQHQRMERVLKLFQRAADAKCLELDMFPLWVELLREGGCRGAVGEVCKTVVQQFPHSAKAWSLSIQHLCVSLAAASDVMNCIHRAETLLPDNEMWAVWEPALLYLSASNYENLETVLEKPCYNLTRQLGPHVRLFYLRWTALTKDINATRKMFDRWYTVKPVSMDFYNEYIKQELMQDIVDMKRVRVAFERAITDHGKNDPEVWLQYMGVEVAYGDPLLTGALGTRALKNLAPGPLQELFFRKRSGVTDQ